MQFIPCGRLLPVGKPHRNAVIGPQALHFHPEAPPQLFFQRQRPRRMDTRPEGRQETHAPIAKLVAETFDHDVSIGRHDPRRGLLLRDEIDQILARVGIQRIM